MDSKQLVNDIVNKRLSKAKKTINEELSNHVLKHIESKRSDVINEAISFEPGVAKAAGAGVAAAGLAGAGIAKGVKALHKRFGAVGRLKAKTDREGKKTEKAEAKKELAWLKGPKKKIEKENAKRHKPGRGVSLEPKQVKDNNKIDDQIEEYANTFSITTSTLEMKCVDGWFNVLEKYDFQDYHTHRPNILSCVYFLNCEEEAGAKLLFRNTNDFLVDYCSSESSLLPLIFHQPFPGKLVIFSSHLEHAVQQQNTNNTRITLAYNYK